jgi:hypothetical protein
VSERNGTADFYSDMDEANQEWGSSLWHWSNKMSKRHSFQVPLFELDWFLRYHLGQASAFPGGAPDDDTLTLMKFDAELAEFTALPPAIESGSLCSTVDRVQLEQHGFLLQKMVRQHLPVNGRPAEEEVQNLKRSLQDAIQHAKELQASGQCRTVIEHMSRYGTR